MRWRRGRESSGTSPRMNDEQLRTTWQLVSLLLDYPSEELLARADALTSALAEVPADVARELAAYLSDLTGTELSALREDYVDTFDVTRKCALHLTYFTSGDTRRRGVALVQVKQAYRRAGVELAVDELPDFLPVVLEFGAFHDLDTAWRLLEQHRVGIELLRGALNRRHSRWLPVVDALRATLPLLDGEGEEALRRLIAQGPPQEEVGLDTQPYALDPRLNPRPESFGAMTSAGAPAGTSTDLGTDIPVGAPR